MNKHEKNSIKKYDELAGGYDNTFDGKFTARFKKNMLKFCTVKDGDSILDVGCGNGSLISEISKQADIRAHGVDISPKMIEECRRRYEGIAFEVSSGENLNFEDNSFDTVAMCCVLHHLNDPQKFFTEARRVLKLGGTLIVGEPWFPWGVRHIIDWIISPLLKAGDNKIFSHKRLKRLATEGGFEMDEIYKKGSIQIIKARKI